MIGILDLQGGVAEHHHHLALLGVATRRVKGETDMVGLSGLIIPGGESTCISRLMRIFSLDTSIREAYSRGMKLWGTCAGAIILAAEIIGEEPHLGLIDITVERNSFGSQLDSFTAEAHIPRISPTPLPLTFIRAPKILRVGPGVTILLEMDDYIAAAETEGVLVTIFHPELTGSLAFHHYFAEKCGEMVVNKASWWDPAWSVTSWTRFAPIDRVTNHPT